MEDANKAFKGNKKLKKIDLKKLEIEEQEKAISNKHDKAKLLLEQANALMEESQSMAKFLTKEKVLLDEAEKKIQKAIIKTSCKKAVKNNLSYVDINNNQSDSDSSRLINIQSRDNTDLRHLITILFLLARCLMTINLKKISNFVKTNFIGCLQEFF